MAQHDWNGCYVAGTLPWDTGEPDSHLVQAVRTASVPLGRALEVGCGTGTNAAWLAEHGFSVLGIDVAPAAIEQARKKTRDRCRFEVLDFLTATPDGAPFDFVFDRGCFHVFDAPEERARFATRVAALLAPNGQWLSLIGSTEGPARDRGPPRRSAIDIATAIEPSLELVELRATTFEIQSGERPLAWYCRARRRDVPAQPSSRR